MSFLPHYTVEDCQQEEESIGEKGERGRVEGGGQRQWQVANGDAREFQ